MKIKGNNGFVGIDMVVAILAIMVFSGLIVSLMYNNAIENLKIRREALATIYLTETLENIGMAAYEEVTQENAQNFIPEDLVDKKYDMNITVTSNLELEDNQDENIIKKVEVTISYEVGNKKYQNIMQRVKIKE